MITTRMIGLDAARLTTVKLPLALQTQVKAVFHAVGEQALDITKALTPVRTGNLRAHNVLEFIDTGTAITFMIYNYADYVVPVCFGTKTQKAQDFMTPGAVWSRRQLETLLNGLSEL